MNHVINVNPQGRLATIFSDRLPLARLGKLEVTRASHVEFNPHSQEWEVEWTSNPGEVAFSDPSRAACLEWEVARLQEIMAARKSATCSFFP